MWEARTTKFEFSYYRLRGVRWIKEGPEPWLIASPEPWLIARPEPRRRYLCLHCRKTPQKLGELDHRFFFVMLAWQLA